MRRFHKLSLVGAGLLVATLILSLSWWLRPSLPAASLSAAQSLTIARAMGGVGSVDSAGFKRATIAHTWVFPDDHGPHPDYQNEWWYYTGNLTSADGSRWGYQLTFFRTGLLAKPSGRESRWAANDVYLAHFAVTDGANQKFYATSQQARGGKMGLAGAQAGPYRVFVNSWKAETQGKPLPLDVAPSDLVHLAAASEHVAIDLNVQALTLPVVQGDNGRFQKSSEPGQASYYYSLPRLTTEGTIIVAGKAFKVTGLSWFEHEWGTQQLGPQQIGWDWFALQMEDGHSVMWYQFQRADGTLDRAFSKGSLIPASGTNTRYLTSADGQVDILDTWTSPHTGVRYPSRWRLQIPSSEIDLQIEPLISDQELRVGLIYWEGAVTFQGTSQGKPVRGRGYVELAGYADRQLLPPNVR